MFIKSKVAILLCATLLFLFAAQSWLAVQTKGPTADEPLHAASAYLCTFDGEYRVDAEDPPLWKYWGMLVHQPADIHIERQGTYWDWAIDDPRNQSRWSGAVFFRMPGNDGGAFIGRSRFMFLIASVALGASISLWSWRLGGGLAAIIATALYTFDPNFLGHAPLFKNDVCIALAFVLCMIAIYFCGRRMTWANVVYPGVALGAAMTIKFSGVLLIPMIGIALLARAMLPDSWECFHHKIAGRGQKLFVSIGLMVMTLAMAWLIIWGMYRFRFAPAADGSRLDIAKTLDLVAANRFYLHEHRRPVGSEADGWQWNITTKLAVGAERMRLLPQAWIGGFLFTYQSTLVRPAFLLGRIYDTGCWYYFPLAFLFKTPLATLGAIFLAITCSIVLAIKRTSIQFANAWPAVCVFIPILVYGGSVISSNLNLGMRHLFPIMPFVFIIVGNMLANAQAIWPRAVLAMLYLLALGLVVETCAAFPDFISFFNIACGNAQSRMRLLGDSNLDWGQDIPALTVWQSAHPDVPLYVLCFGPAVKEFYGVHSIQSLDRPCMVALSATMLQGLYLPPGDQDLFAPLRQRTPTNLLDGTIYLYRYPEDFPNMRLPGRIKEIQQQFGVDQR